MGKRLSLGGARVLDARLTRRALVRGVLLASVTGVLAACGDSRPEPGEGGSASAPAGAGASATPDSPAETSSSPTAARVETPQATAATSAFPVAIEHKFGLTEIPAEPQRVVALGYSDQDPLLALGVRPIAVRYWFGDEPYAVFPWARDELGDARPEVLDMPFGELDFERIAALRPDFISAVYSGITEQEYRTLAQIAPMLAQSGEYIDFGMPWQEATLLIGRALNREELVQELVSEVEARFAAARAGHPEWAGKRVVVGAPRGDGQFGFVASQDARSRVFTALGFEVPPELDEIAGDQFWGTVSLERADLLDQDLLVFHQLAWVEGGRAAIESDPLLRRLRAMQEGRVLFLEGQLDAALQFGTVLSLPFLLDHLVPMIEAAMDGDPETEPTL